MMSLSVLRLVAIPDRRRAILEILRTLERRNRGRLGCMECEIYERQGDDDTAILYLEKWESNNDLERHIQSDSYILLLTTMEFARDKPEIYFFEIPDTRRWK